MNHESNPTLANALWRIYRRPDRPIPWVHGGNLPWNDPDFSQRMLREHLDESQGAASRIPAERASQIDWFWSTLGLAPGARILDITCGPGLYAVNLAERGCSVTGVDFSPAAIEYARRLAQERRVAARCTFIEQDVRESADWGTEFDAALFIYGQLAVFPVEEAQALLAKICQALRPGGQLVIELLNQERVDKQNGSWWFSDHTGLWGDAPYLHLGERFWLADQKISVERFYTIHLDTGRMDEITLCDQTYSESTMTNMLQAAGFSWVQVYHAWAGLPIYDAEEWNVYLATKAG